MKQSVRSAQNSTEASLRHDDPGLSRREFLHLAALAGTVGVTGLSLGGCGTTTDIEFNTKYLRYAIGMDGTVTAFEDSQHGKDYLARTAGQPIYFMSIVYNGVMAHCTAVQRAATTTIIDTSTLTSVPVTTLSVAFGGTPVKAKVVVSQLPDYLTFELTELSTPSLTVGTPVAGENVVEIVTFGSTNQSGLVLSLADEVGLGLAYGQKYDVTVNGKTTPGFAGLLVALNVWTRTDCWYNDKSSVALRAAAESFVADRRVTPVGAKFAMAGCPPDQVLAVVSQIEVDNGLPHPVLSGEWGKVSRDAKLSYLYVTPQDKTTKPADYDNLIQSAQLGGFSCIMVDVVGRAGATGFLLPGDVPAPIDGGPTDLATITEISNRVNVVKQSGGDLKLGLHLDSFPNIAPYVAQARVAAGYTSFLFYPGLSVTLAQPLVGGGNDQTLVTNESTAGFLPGPPTEPDIPQENEDIQDLRSYGLLIEDLDDSSRNEIIQYNRLRQDLFGFTLTGSAPQNTPLPSPPLYPHKHATIRNLIGVHNPSEGGYFYYPDFAYTDFTGNLYATMLAELKATIDTYQFDMVYLDWEFILGPNVQWPMGLPPQWYIVNLIVSKLYEKVTPPVLFAGLTRLTKPAPLPGPPSKPGTDLLWHVDSRGGGTDILGPVEVGPGVYVPVTTTLVIDKVNESLPGPNPAWQDLLPIELGWLGFGGVTSYTVYDATRPREIEYAWSKALAYRACMSLEPRSFEDFTSNGRRGELLALMKDWEQLRLSNQLPEAIRLQMKPQGSEFTLTETGQVVPVTYQDNGAVPDPSTGLDASNTPGNSHNPNTPFAGTATWTFGNPNTQQAVFISIDTARSGVAITNPTLTLTDAMGNRSSIVFPFTLEAGWYLEYAASGVLQVFDQYGNLYGGYPPPQNLPNNTPPKLVAGGGSNSVEFSYDELAKAAFNSGVRVTLGTQGLALS